MSLPAVFDLDGTISDPAEGIGRSINHALRQFGHAPRRLADLHLYIGPALTETFCSLVPGVSDQRVDELISAYRERFWRIGFSENTLYPGIVEALKEVHSRGYTLHIATAKRRDQADKVLDHFDIAGLFESVHGCDLTRTKSELLADIQTLTGVMPAVIVGDRASDLAAGREAGVPSIGVSWGFGGPEELADADFVVGAPRDLPEAIESFRRLE